MSQPDITRAHEWRDTGNAWSGTHSAEPRYVKEQQCIHCGQVSTTEAPETVRDAECPQRRNGPAGVR